MCIKIQEKNSNICEIKNSEKIMDTIIHGIDFLRANSVRETVSDSGKQIEAALYQNL